MFLGKVVGTVWATRKDERISSLKLLIVRPYGWYRPAHDADHVVAIDNLDAGVGDDVVVCFGAPARWSLGRLNLPVEASVAAVVDRTEVDPLARSLPDAPFRFKAGPAPKGVEEAMCAAQPEEMSR